MRYVPTDLRGEIITLTIGGNDLIADMQLYLEGGLDAFGREHLALLRAIRATNPEAAFIVGNIYAPQSPLTKAMSDALDAANQVIAENVRAVDAALADVRETFRGRESELLCFDIEPSLAGAAAIAELFWESSR
jgi:lysophospholipase L1-like esterase